jgi:hypothetical protein
VRVPLQKSNTLLHYKWTRCNKFLFTSMYPYFFFFFIFSLIPFPGAATPLFLGLFPDAATRLGAGIHELGKKAGAVASIARATCAASLAPEAASSPMSIFSSLGALRFVLRVSLSLFFLRAFATRFFCLVLRVLPVLKTLPTLVFFIAICAGGKKDL